MTNKAVGNITVAQTIYKLYCNLQCVMCVCLEAGGLALCPQNVMDADAGIRPSTTENVHMLNMLTSILKINTFEFVLPYREP